MPSNNPLLDFRWHQVPKLSVLSTGHVIRNKGNPSKSYIITANYGDHVTAVTSVDITNPDEWEILEISNNPANEIKS